MSGLLLALALGGFLVVSAARPLLAELQALPARALAESLQGGQPLSLTEAREMAETSERAAALAASADHWQRAAIARLKIAEMHGIWSNQGLRETESALAMERESLTAAPGNSFGWLWLSQVEARVHGISPLSTHAWRLSVEAEPFAPDIEAMRLRVGLLQWSRLDETDRAVLAETVRKQAARQVWGLVEPAIQADGTKIIRQILLNDPPKLAAFNQGVASYLPNK
ncbi:MAG TPA: hypothetical protein VN809_01955 [Telmatospirillum sp.]|nr:hypothetical protein [Telmatospirillum sp.]